MLKTNFVECICLLITLTMEKPVPGLSSGNIPPDSAHNLVLVSLLVAIAALAVLGMAVGVGVLHRSASDSGTGASDDEFEDSTSVATMIADEDQINAGRTQEINGKTTRGKDVS